MTLSLTDIVQIALVGLTGIFTVAGVAFPTRDKDGHITRYGWWALGGAMISLCGALFLQIAKTNASAIAARDERQHFESLLSRNEAVLRSVRRNVYRIENWEIQINATVRISTLSETFRDEVKTLFESLPKVERMSQPGEIAQDMLGRVRITSDDIHSGALATAAMLNQTDRDKIVSHLAREFCEARLGVRFDWQNASSTEEPKFAGLGSAYSIAGDCRDARIILDYEPQRGLIFIDIRRRKILAHHLDIQLGERRPTSVFDLNGAALFVTLQLNHEDVEPELDGVTLAFDPGTLEVNLLGKRFARVRTKSFGEQLGFVFPCVSSQPDDEQRCKDDDGFQTALLKLEIPN
jgi:hypothetical protein